MTSSDPDGDPVVYSSVVNSGDVTTSIADSVLTMTPGADWNGAASITVTVDDGKGASDSKTFALTVTPVNDAPVLAAVGNQSTNEETAKTISVSATDLEGDTLTYSATVDNGDVTVSQSGQDFTFTPADDAYGDATLTFNVSDGNGGTDSETIILTVNNVNDDPILGAIGNQTTTEDVSITLALSVTDPDPDTHTYSATIDSGDVTATVTGSSLVLAPAADWNGTATLTVTVDDNAGSTDSETFDLLVTAVNDAPIFAAVNESTTEDTAKTFALSATDAEGDTVTYASATVNSGNFTANLSGANLTLTPAADWSGTASLTVTATDGNGGTGTLTFDFPVTAVNDAPVLAAVGNQSTDEDTAKILTLAAADIEGDSLTYTATVGSGDVTASVTGNQVTLTPAADWNGNAAITIGVSDGNGGSDSEAITLTVNAVNDAPVLAAIGNQTSDEDMTKTLALTSTDVEDDTVTYTASVGAGNVTANITGATLDIVPAADWQGTATLTVTASDGNGGTDSETFNVVYSDVNDAPVLAAIGDQTTDEDTTKALTLSATDTEGDSLTYSASVTAGNVTATVTGTNLALVPADDWNGAATITVSVDDGNGGTDSETFTLTVTAVNDAPVLTAIGAQSTNEDTTKTLALAATDTEGDDLTFAATVDSGNITATVTGTSLALVPADDWSGSATITVSVEDGNGGTDSEAVTLTVTAVNDAPVLAAIGDQSTDEDTDKTLTLAATDTESDSLTYTAAVNSGSVTATVSGTDLTLAPAEHWHGTAEITVTVDDGNGGTDSETFDLTVASVNDAPVLTAIGNQNTNEDVTKTLTLAGTDADADSLTYVAAVNSGNITATVTGTSLALVPAADWLGTANITVTVSDGNGGTDAESFNLVVAEVNDPPVLAAIGNQTTDEDTTKSLTLAATDAEGDSLTYSASVTAGSVTATVSGSNLSLVPAADWNGAATITATVDDGNGGTDSETFTLTVTAVNDAPVLAVIGNQLTQEDTDKVLTLAATDTEGDTIAYAATVDSGNVTATLAGTQLTLAPGQDWLGTATISVSINDGNGGTDSETFNLTVTNVNDVPVLDGIGDQSTDEDTTKTLTLSASDPDGDSLTYAATVNSGDVTATVTGTQLDLVPDANWNGTANITITVDDGNGGTDSETYDLVVTAVNDAPVLTEIGNQTTNEDTTKTLTLASSDVESDAVTYSATVDAGDITATVTGTQLDLVPDAHWFGTAQVTVTADDGNGGTDSEQFDLVVSSVNDVPVLAAIGDQSTNEDVTKAVALSATDDDGDTLVYSATVNTGNASANVSGSTLNLVPDADWSGTANITVTVSDGNGGTDSETLDLVVAAVNDAPVLTSIGAQTTNEDITKSLNLNSSDTEGDALTYTAIVNSGSVVATVTGNQLDLAPVADWNGTANLTVNVSDGNGGSDSETFDLVVVAVNDAPVLAAVGAQTTNEDTTKTLTLAATDTEGDTLTYSAVVNAGSISTAVSGTQLDLIPDADWNGAATITVSVDDGNGGTDSETFTFTVTAVNDAPVLAAIGAQSTNEDVTKSIALSSTDTEGDTITYSAVINSGDATATVTGANLDLVPDADWFGNVSVTVTANDGNGGTDSETLVLAVAAVNDAPVLAAIGAQTTNEDIAKVLTLSSTDVEGDNLTYTPVVNSGSVTATQAGSQLTLTPDADWNGTASITVTVADGNGGTDNETFNLTVSAINDDPVLAAIGAQTTNEDVTKSITLAATDTEGDTLTYSAAVVSGDVTATVTGTNLDIIPDADWNGAASITVTVDDGQGGSDSETVAVTVTAVNDAPVLAAVGDQSTNEDVTKSLTLSATDTENDTLTYAAVINSGNVTATVTGTNLDLVPDADWSGTANITITVDDGNGGTDDETIDLTVTAVNDAPVLAAIGDQSTNEDTTKSLTLSATDTESDTLTYSAVVNSGDVTATVTGTNLDLVPDANWNGTANVTVTVDDGNGGSDSETYDLTVVAVNDAPVLAAVGDQSTNEDTTKSLTLAATDTEGDSLTYSAAVVSGNVTATVTGTNLELIPAADWNESSTITITVDDGNGGTDDETITLTVAAVNDAPVLAAIGNQSTNDDNTKSLALAATDVEGDTLTYSAVVNSGDITATLTGTNLDLIPDANWNGTANITVTVNDGNGGSDNETFDLVVNAVNDAPVLAAVGDQSTNEDTTKSLTLSGTDTENDTLTYSAVVNSGNVTATVTGTNLDLVPADDWSGTANVAINVSDCNGGTDTETIDLTVNAVNDAPVLAGIGNQSTNEDTTKSLTLSGTDTEGDSLTYSANVDSGNITATVTGTNLDLVPVADRNGVATITVTVDDGNGGTDDETFKLTVDAVNDAPVLAAIGDQSIAEDNTQSLVLASTDTEGDTITYSVTVNSGSVTANLAGVNLDLVPADDWNGTANITVSIDDGNGGSDSETFTLTVTAVNDAPVLASVGNQSTNEDTTKILTLSATDVENDTLTYSAVVDSGDVTATVTGTQLDLVPDLNWSGVAVITVTVDDGNATDSEQFNLTVSNVNDSPVLAAVGDQTVEEDGTLSITLSSTDADLDAPTYTATVSSGNVTATVTGNDVDFTPAANWNGVASVTLSVDDGNGGTDTEAILLTVTAVNDAPVLTNIPAQATNEDAALVVALSGTDTEGDTLTYTAVVDSGDVTAAVSGSQLMLTPDADWNGAASITVTVDDGNGGTDNQAFALTVNAVNDAPVLAAIGDQTTDEDVTKSLTLDATDTEGDARTYTATVNSGSVTATVSGTDLDLVPDADWNGTASITINVSDGNGGSDTETFNLVVAAVNDAPVLASIGNQGTNEDVVKNITLAGTDTEGDSLTYTAVVNAGDVTANFVGTALTLTPAADWNGSANITVTVDDGNTGTDAETFDLVVAAVNDAPVLAAIGNQSTDEDNAKVVNLAGTDTEGDSLTYSAIVNTGNVTAGVSGTTLTLTPATDWNGTANITVTVDDGNTGTDSETIDLVVNAVNDAPVLAAIGDQTTAEDTDKVVALAATDTEGDSLTYSVAVNSGDVSASVAGTTLTIDPDANWNGTANLTVTVNDGTDTDTETFDVVVTAVNDAPVLAAIGAQTTNEDTDKDITLSATDTEDDALTYSASVISGNVTATVAGTNLNLSPDADWNGSATITVTVDDGNSGSDSKTITLTVTAVNDAPVLAAIGDQNTNEDVTQSLTLSGTDTENDTLTYSAVVNSGDVTATVTGANLDLVPDADWNGTANITVTVDDGNGGTDDETFDLVVAAVNDAPVLAAIGDQSTNEDVTQSLTLAATDTEGDGLTYTAVVDSGNVTATVTGTNLDLVPDANWNGTATITVTVDDGNGGTDDETYDLVVAAVNDAPVLAAIGDQSTNEDVTKTVTLAATDIEADPLTYAATVNSGDVSTSVSGTTLNLVPDADWNGTANITVTVDDGNGGTDSETFDMVVAAVNDAPVLAEIPAQSTNEDVTKSVTLSATDTEGDGLTYSAVVNSGNVTATVTGTNLDLDPADDWFGTASITVTVDDGNGGSDSKSFTLSVGAVNDAPVLAAIGNQTTNEDETLVIALTVSDTEGDSLTVTANVDSGDISANVAGTTLSLVPDADWNGTAQVTVTVDDGNGGSDSETFNLAVTAVNDAPVLAAIGDQDTDEDNTETLTLSATDTEGDTLTYSAVVNSGNVTPTVTGTQLDLAPDADWNGTANVTVTVNDGNGGTDTETFDLVVNAVNDAPVITAIADQTTAEDTPAAFALSGTDTENDTLVYSVVVDAGDVAAVVNGTTLNLTPDANWNGTATFTVTVNDGNGGTDSDSFDLVVTAVNDFPVLAAIGAQATDEDTNKSITLSATDVENPAPTFSAVVNTGNVAANVTGTQLDFVPSANWFGTASITVTVDDGTGGTDSETFALEVAPVNDAPVLAAIADQTTAEDTPKNVALSSTDTEGDSLTYSVAVNSGSLSANTSGAQLTITPDADWVGSGNITVTVDDGNGGTDSQSLAVTITAVNDAPVLAAIGDQTTDEDTPFSVGLSASDTENDALTYGVTVDYGDIAAAVAGTNLTVTPDSNWNGLATITVTVDDGNGGSDSETLAVTVTAVNDAPVLDNIPALNTNEDTTLVHTLSATDVEGDTLTYTPFVNSGDVTTSMAGTKLNVVPADDWNGTANITVTVDDGNGGTDSQAFDVVVDAVNDAPVLAAIGDQSTDEDTIASVTLSATDIEADTLVYTAVVNSGNLTATVTGTNLDLDPDADWFGTANVTVTVNDLNGGTDSETIDVVVASVNDAPVLAAIGAKTTAEDTPVSLSLSASDTEGDTVTFSANVDTTDVTATVTGNQLDLAPAADWFGTANVTVNVVDSNGGTDAETFVFSVTTVNDAPVLAAIGAQTTNEDNDLAITLAATDTENDTLTYSVVVNSGNLTATVTGTQLDLVPDPDWNGTASLTVTVQDTSSGSDNETFALEVVSVNDAPVLAAIGNQTTDEDTPLTHALSATDIDADTLTYSVVVNSGDITAAVSGTDLELTPAADWNGTANVTVTVDDGNGGSDSETLDLVVNAVNDAPVLAAIGNQATDEDTPLSIQLSSTDTEDDTVSYSVSSDNLNVAAAIAGSQLALTPASNWVGSASITVTANDGNGGTDSETFTATINAVNDQPVLATIGAQTTNEDTPLILTLSASDVESSAFVFSTKVESGEISTAIAGSTLTVTPAKNWFGAASLTVTVSDGTGGTDSETFNITVTSVNDAPVLAAIGNQTTTEDNAKSITLASTDDDGDAVTYSAEVNSGNVTASITGSQLALTPTAHWHGNASITVTAADGNGGTDAETFNLVVSSVNDAPFLAPVGDQDTQEDTPITITLVSSDADNDDPAYSAKVDDGKVDATISGSDLVLSPNPDWNGDATITITVQDGNGGSDSETITLTVAPVNDAPVLAAIGTQQIEEDASITLTLSATDTEGDALTYSGAVDTTNVAASVNGTQLQLQPAANWNGSAKVTVTVSDGNGGTDSEVFDLVITPLNDLPVLTAVPGQTTNEDTPLTLTLASTDQENDTPTYSATVNTPNVAAAINGSQLTLTPVANWFGLAKVTVTVDDGNGGTDSGLFNLTVQSVNDAPVLAAIGAQTTNEGTNLTVPVSATDIEDDPITFSAAVLSGSVTASVSGSNLVIVPADDWNGVATVNVTASDPNGGSDTGSFDVTVISVNDAPILDPIGDQTTLEDALHEIVLSAFDVDNDPLVYTATINSGEVSYSLDGALLGLTGDFEWSGTASITVSVSDGNGGSDSETFQLEVIDVNDPPEISPIGTQTTPEDTPKSITLAASDIEGDAISFSFTVNSGNITASLAGNQLTMTPDANWSGTAVLTVTAEDARGATSAETFNLDVAQVNDAPVLATIDDMNTEEDTSKVITLAATDIEGHNLVYTATSTTNNVTLSVSGSQLTMLPVVNWVGKANITVTVNDGNGGADSQTFEFKVKAVNDAPHFDPVAKQTIKEDTSITIELVALDIDAGDVLTFSAAVISGNVKSQVVGNQLTLTPDFDWSGTANITATVTDQAGASDTITFDLQVTPFNIHSPINIFPTGKEYVDSLRPHTFSVADGNAIQVTDGDSYSATLSLEVFHGILTLNQTVGLEFRDDTEDSSSKLVVRGSLTDINAALDGMQYLPDTGYVGEDPMQIQSLDTGTLGDIDELSLIVEYVAIPGLPTQPLSKVAKPGVNLELALVGDYDRNLLESVTVDGDGNNMELIVKPVPGLQNGEEYHTEIQMQFAYSDSTASNITIPVVIYTAKLTVQNSEDGRPTFNPVTGLFQQLVVAENPTNYTMEALRVYIKDLPTDIKLRSLYGVSEDGLPYVQYDIPLTPGESQSFTFEYLTDSVFWTSNEKLILELLPDPDAPPEVGALQIVDMELKVSSSGVFFIYFLTEKDTDYFIQYSSSPSGPWFTSPIRVIGTGKREVWLDDGPPKTDIHPSKVPSRFYRVVVPEASE